MAKYIQQGQMSLPSEGSNQIHHFMKTFENFDKSLLDFEVNLWFESLIPILSSPIIQRVNFSTVVTPNPGAALLYVTQIHYILVE